jgi:hypothetical protein
MEDLINMNEDTRASSKVRVARSLNTLSTAVRVLSLLASLVLFAMSVSQAWGWPVARGAVAFLILLAFFLDFSKRELGSYRAILNPQNLRRLSTDSKFLGLEVLLSVVVNLAVVAIDLAKTSQ